MADFYTVLTTLGENKLANASVTGPRVRPAEVAVGDGGGPNFYDLYGRAALKARTSLVNERFRTTVNDLRVEADNPNWIVVDGLIPANEGGYNIREVGIIDEDGDLIAIGRFPQTFKPVLSSGAFQDMIVRVIMEVSDVAALTLQVDPSAVLATRQFVLEQRRPFVRTPSVVSPYDGEGGLAAGMITIIGSPWSPLYSVDQRGWRQFQVQVAGGDWSDPIADEQLDQDDFTFMADPDTNYETRIRDRRFGGPTTDWSTVVGFTTADTYIQTPTNISPPDGATDQPEQPVLEGSAFSVIGGSDTHIASRFRIYNAATGELVHDSGVIDATVKYTLPANVLQPNRTAYEWDVQYRGDVLGWSGRSTRTSFTTEASFVPKDGAEGEPFGGGYFTARMKDENGDWYALVMSPAAEGQNNGNTMTWQNAMNYAAGLTIGGHDDWKLMTRDEARVAYRKLKPGTGSNSTSYGATDKVEPPLGNYTSGDPSQTSLAAWRDGGAEAFIADSYWTADESGSSAYRVYFSNGSEGLATKTLGSYVRAVRRVYF